LWAVTRDIPGDAAHVSVTSLNCHDIENPADHSAMLMVHPPLDDLEMHLTFVELGISTTIATLILMKVREKTDLWDECQTLLRRYKKLTRLDDASPRTG